MSNKFSDEQCIDWIKIQMNSYHKYTTGYEWSMLLAILERLERLKELEKNKA